MFTAIGVGAVTASGIDPKVPPPAGLTEPASELAERKYVLISLLMTNLYPVIPGIGYIQAAKVIPTERSSPGDGVDPRLLSPSNMRARPNFP